MSFGIDMLKGRMRKPFKSYSALADGGIFFPIKEGETSKQGKTKKGLEKIADLHTSSVTIHDVKPFLTSYDSQTVLIL